MKKYRFLAGGICIYVLLNIFFLYKIDYFFSEEVIPFLSVSPKIVSAINETQGGDQNIYSVYQKGLSAENFRGQINYIGSIKTASSPSNHFTYIWELSNGYRLPIMKNEGSGMLFYYVHKLFFRDEYNFFLIKLHIILVGILILVIMWFFLIDFINIKVANLAVILLGTSRLFSYKIEGLWFSDNYSLLSIFLIILLLWKYIKNRKLRYLYLCAFTVGVALYIKLIALWFLAALFILFIYHRPRLNIRFKNIVNCCLFLVLGCLPLIIYNIDSTGGSFLGIKNGFLTKMLTVQHWSDNIVFAVFENIAFFLEILVKNFPEQFIILLIVLLIYFSFKSKMDITDIINRRLSLFWMMALVMLVVMFCSAKKNTQYYTNLLVLLVMPQAATLVSVYDAQKDKIRNYAKNIIYAIVGGFIILNICLQYEKQAWLLFYLNTPLGADRAITEYLLKEKEYTPVTFEYGLVGTVEFLSKGQIRPLHYYAMLREARNHDEKLELTKKIILNNPDALFIIKLDKYHQCIPNVLHKDLEKLSQPKWRLLCLKKIVYNNKGPLYGVLYKDFVDLSKFDGLPLCLDKVIYNRAGEAEYVILKLADNDCDKLLHEYPAVFLESPL